MITVVGQVYPEQRFDGCGQVHGFSNQRHRMLTVSCMVFRNRAIHLVNAKVAGQVIGRQDEQGFIRELLLFDA
jgi:hypothetical protein